MKKIFALGLILGVFGAFVANAEPVKANTDNAAPVLDTGAIVDEDVEIIVEEPEDDPEFEPVPTEDVPEIEEGYVG